MVYAPEGISLYRDIIEGYQGSIIVVDRSGTLIFVNRGACELSGRSEQELLGWSAYDLVRIKVFSRSTLTETLETGKSVTRYLMINGDTNRGILATSVPICDEAGKLRYVIAYSQGEAFAKEHYAKLELEKHQMLQMLSSLLIETKNYHFICESPETKKLFQLAEVISGVSATVLITGESGTGKEVLARHIHKKSDRAGSIFLPVNCAAIPAELMESELFGYEKGAFTGANRTGKPGLLELADQGTLFLDEIGELPLPLQSKLLRALELGEVRRIGGNTTNYVDVRIIAATNRNLMSLVQQGKFREDLYYRLNVIPLHIPPLRERAEDIAALIDFFVLKYNTKHHLQTSLSDETKRRLLDYAWPGNVRELKNVLQRLVITDGAIGGLPGGSQQEPGLQAGQSHRAPEPDSSLLSVSYREYMEGAERAYLERVLQLCHGDVSQMSERLGLHVSGIYRKLDKYGLEPKRCKYKIPHKA